MEVVRERQTGASVVPAPDRYRLVEPVRRFCSQTSTTELNPINALPCYIGNQSLDRCMRVPAWRPCSFGPASIRGLSACGGALLGMPRDRPPRPQQASRRPRLAHAFEELPCFSARGISRRGHHGRASRHAGAQVPFGRRGRDRILPREHSGRAASAMMNTSRGRTKTSPTSNVVIILAC